MARASAASSVSLDRTFGSQQPFLTIIWICFLSPWPTPITAFLTRWSGVFGDPQAGTRAGYQHGHRRGGLSELQRGRSRPPSRLTKVCSTASLVRCKVMKDGRGPGPSWDLAETGGKFRLVVRSDGACRNEAQRIALRFESGPSPYGGEGPGSIADDANRRVHSGDTSRSRAARPKPNAAGLWGIRRREPHKGSRNAHQMPRPS